MTTLRTKRNRVRFLIALASTVSALYGVIARYHGRIRPWLHFFLPLIHAWVRQRIQAAARKDFPEFMQQHVVHQAI